MSEQAVTMESETVSVSSPSDKKESSGDQEKGIAPLKPLLSDPAGETNIKNNGDGVDKVEGGDSESDVKLRLGEVNLEEKSDCVVEKNDMITEAPETEQTETNGQLKSVSAPPPLSPECSGEDQQGSHSSNTDETRGDGESLEAVDPTQKVDLSSMNTEVEKLPVEPIDDEAAVDALSRGDRQDTSPSKGENDSKGESEGLKEEPSSSLEADVSSPAQVDIAVSQPLKELESQPSTTCTPDLPSPRLAVAEVENSRAPIGSDSIDDSSPTSNLVMDVSFASADTCNLSEATPSQLKTLEEPMEVDGPAVGAVQKSEDISEKDGTGSSVGAAASDNKFEVSAASGEDERPMDIEKPAASDEDECPIDIEKPADDLKTVDKKEICREGMDKDSKLSSVLGEVVASSSPAAEASSDEIQVVLSDVKSSATVDEVVATAPVSETLVVLAGSSEHVTESSVSAKPSAIPVSSSPPTQTKPNSASNYSTTAIQVLEAVTKVAEELIGKFPSTVVKSVESAQPSTTFQVAPMEGGAHQIAMVSSINHPPVLISRVSNLEPQAAVSKGVVPPAVPLHQLDSKVAQMDSSQSVLISRMAVSSSSSGAELIQLSVSSSSGNTSSATLVSSSSPPLTSAPSSSYTALSLSSASLSDSGTGTSIPDSTTSAALSSSIAVLPKSSEKAGTQLVKVGPGTLAMPALTAVAPTVLTASTPVIATPTTSSRQASTTTKKPILSAGLSPTLSSNLAALFPSHAGKFAVPGSYAVSMSSTGGSSSEGSALVKVQQSARHPVVVTPGGINSGKAVVVTPVLSDKKSDGVLARSGEVIIKGLSTGSGASTVPVITKIMSSKGGVISGLSGGTAISIDPSSIAGSSPASKLKAGRAKALHSGSSIQHVAIEKEIVSPDKLPPGMQSLSFDFTQFMMPKVLGVQTVGPASEFKKSGSEVEEPIPVVRVVNTAVVGLDVKAAQPGPKPSSHPVARRIWMSSCRPLDPASLERIGTDAAGNVYWYDGGKNLFQSPPTSDPAYKPSESELQLSCKSMVQWMARLKELRSSGKDEDISLAQTIKDQYLNRVRVATQRKSRDNSLFQKLQAVHNFPLSSSSPQGSSMVQATTNQIKVLTSQATTAGDAAAKLLPSSFPQGSILVVPHTPGSYQTVLPVFANTAVIMPQGGPLTSTTSASSSSVSSSSSVATSSVSESTILSQASSSAAVITQASMPQSVVTSSITPTATPTVVGFPTQQSAAIAIDGRLFGLPGGPIAVSGANSAQMVKLVQQAMASAGVLGTGGGVITAPVIQGQIPSSSTSSDVLGKSIDEPKKQDGSGTSGGASTAGVTAPPILPGSVFTHQGLPFNQMFLTPSGLVMPNVYTMKVEEPVPVGKVSLESTSIELTGQVPIKMIDRETMDVVKSSEGSGLVKDQEGKEKEALTETLGKDGTREVEKEAETGNGKKKDKDVVNENKEGMKKTSDGNKKDKPITVSDSAQKKTPEAASSGSGFHGHSTADIMSAELLLSLTGGTSKSWPATPPKKGLGQKESPGGLVTSSPSSGDTHTPSSGRKRKQKPIASAKPSTQTDPSTGKDAPLKADVSLSMPKAKRPRRTKKDENTVEESAKQNTGKEGVAPKKSKEFTPQELLEILNIPPSSGPDNSVAASAPGSDASLKMEQLKAARVNKPMKEFVIETDSDSNSSSSSSDSSRHSANSGSSSDSSTESSSNEDSSESKTKTPVKKVATSTRGRGRGRGKGRASGAERKAKASQSSSSDDSSSDSDEDGGQEKKKPGVAQRGRGKRGGASGGRGRGVVKGTEKVILEHIVSIPTRLLKSKLKRAKKVKSGQVDSDEALATKKAVAPDFSADNPIDLASLYAKTGGVDLGTLSELAKSVGVSEEGVENTRSKRTCVRVRQEISKLQEILGDGTSDVKLAKSGGRGGRGRGTSNTASGRSSLGVNQSAEFDDDGSGLMPPTKKKRSSYSQFTHKRRKRKKKQPEEEPLWQPARKQEPGKTLKTIYTFSTLMANEAADAVVTGKYENIIQFHQKQPKGPGFHRHPPGHVIETVEEEAPPSRTLRRGRAAAAAEEKAKEKEREKDKEKEREKTQEQEKEKEKEAEESMEEEKPKGNKRKSTGRPGQASDVAPTSASKKRRSSSQKTQPPPKQPSPPPFLRSSRRLRRQRNPSPSPPPPPSESEEEEVKEKEPEVETKVTPSPEPPPRPSSTRSSSGARGRITRASRRLASARQQRPSTSLADMETSDAKSPPPKTDSISDSEKTPSRLSKTVEETKDKEKEGKAESSHEEDMDADIYKSPATRSPENPPNASQGPPPGSEEDNYTICHGTPRNPVQSLHVDMSSPKDWQGQQQSQQQSQQKQQQQQQFAMQQQQQQQQPVTSFQQSKPRESFGSPGSDQMVSPEAPVTSTPGFPSMASHLPDESRRGVSSASHTPMDHQMSLPPQYAQPTAEAFFQKEWGAGSRAAGYSAGGMPAGYHPGIYGHPMHGMPYASPPAAQAALARPNYPYAVPYSWGHPSAAVHPQQQQAPVTMAPGQGRPGDRMMQTRSAIVAGGSGGTMEAPSYSAHGHTPPIPMHATATASPSSIYGKEARKSYSDSPSSPSPVQGTVPSHPAIADRSSAAAASSAPMRVGSSRDIPQHQLPHGFPPGMAAAASHPQIPHEHLPHHAFPYSFESSSHPSLHMWQQSQMHGHRPISSMHPSHLHPQMAPHGLWYPAGPGTAAQLHPHLIPGQELHAAAAGGGGAKGGGSAKKGLGGKGKRDGGDKVAANRNNSNSNNTASTSAQYFLASQQGNFNDQQLHGVVENMSNNTAQIYHSQMLSQQGLANNIHSDNRSGQSAVTYSNSSNW